MSICKIGRFYVLVVLLSVAFLLVGCGNINNISPTISTFSVMPQTSVKPPTTPTSPPLDTAYAKGKEVFLARFTVLSFDKAGNGADDVSRLHTSIDVFRCGTAKITQQGNSLIITGLNGNVNPVTVDKNSYVDGLGPATLNPGYRWATSALVTITDKQGNVRGTIIVSWNGSDNVLKPINYDISFSDVPSLSSSPLGIKEGEQISTQLNNLQSKINTDYSNAKSTALSNAKAGLPYVIPNIQDYQITQSQAEQIANTFFNVDASLYFP